MLRILLLAASTCVAGAPVPSRLVELDRARTALAEDVVRFCSDNPQLELCRRGRGLLSAADAPREGSLVLTAAEAPRRSYALAELAGLRSGPDAGKARAFLETVKRLGWPEGLFRRLEEAGARIAFYARDRRSEEDRYAEYDFRTKTIYLWTEGPEAAAAELAHAVSDLLEPDDPATCRGMMSLQDPALEALWSAYIGKVNRYLGVGAADVRALVYPREFLVYMTRREVSSPRYWLGGDPILGQRGYLNREEFWEEGVIWHFTRRAKLRAQEPGLAAFVAAKLGEAELYGFKEKAGETPDMSRCF